MNYSWSDLMEALYDDLEADFTPDNDDYDSEDIDTTEDHDEVIDDSIDEYEDQLNDELNREIGRRINRH
jgi:hypothetical protein